MPSSALKRVRYEALELPAEERAELAHDLVVSLDGPAEDDAARAWQDEISQRLQDVDDGSATLISRDEFDQRLRARLRR